VSGLTRLSLFAVLLVAVFAAAALTGNAVDPSGSDADEGQESGGGAHGDEPAARSGDDHGAGHGDGATSAALPGLQIADDGYRLVVERSTLPRASRSEPFAFRVVDAKRATVRDFEVEHDKRMHFIVVRRDMAGFQHLHPTMSADGTWRSRVDFGDGGTYRVFADFKREGTQRTLGADVHVGGGFRPRELPRAAQTAVSDGGLEVTLDTDGAAAGQEATVAFEVRKDGRIVDDELQPYLGAKGHLVALRAGDLAYLHTHPEGDELAFTASYPSAGAYRLFVQFRYENRIHTASFTQEVTDERHR
jgi:hypothetical protein